MPNHAEKMVEAWTEMKVKVKIEEHNTFNRPEYKQVCEYLLNSVIPDEIDYWKEIAQEEKDKK